MSQAPDPLVIHLPAGAAGRLRGTLPRPPRAPLPHQPRTDATHRRTHREVAQALPELTLLVGDLGRVETLGPTDAGRQPCRLAVRRPRTDRGSIATALRLRFGVRSSSAISLSIDLSSSASANSFFRRAFSPSSSLSRLASLVFIPPYWASQRCHVDSAIPPDGPDTPRRHPCRRRAGGGPRRTYG